MKGVLVLLTESDIFKIWTKNSTNVLKHRLVRGGGRSSGLPLKCRADDVKKKDASLGRRCHLHLRRTMAR